MNASPEAATLTTTLLSTVRLQRHLGARIIVSTQEPTISPALLDLSSITIVHRFTSPEWLRTLKGHLAGVASDLLIDKENNLTSDKPQGTSVDKYIFDQVVNLSVGSKLLEKLQLVFAAHAVPTLGTPHMSLASSYFVRSCCSTSRTSLLVAH